MSISIVIKKSFGKNDKLIEDLIVLLRPPYQDEMIISFENNNNILSDIKSNIQNELSKFQNHLIYHNTH